MYFFSVKTVTAKKKYVTIERRKKLPICAFLEHLRLIKKNILFGLLQRENNIEIM